jgi:hypothetical protein
MDTDRGFDAVVVGEYEPALYDDLASDHPPNVRMAAALVDTEQCAIPITSACLWQNERHEYVARADATADTGWALCANSI